MKKYLLAAIVALVGFASAHAADAKDVRKHTGFTQIVNHSGYDIHFYEGDYKVQVMGPQADLKYILMTLADGILTIKHDANHKFSGKPYIVIYAPKNKLKKYTGKGAGNFIAKTTNNLHDDVFTSNGKVGVTLGTVNARNLDLNSQGAGNIKVTKGNVSGKCNKTQKSTGKVTFTDANASTQKSTSTSTQKSTSTQQSTQNSNNTQQSQQKK